MTESLGDPARYEFAFAEARRRIDDQIATLKDVRDRVGMVVSAGAIVAGLAANLAVRGSDAHPLTGWGRAAVLLLGGSFVVMVLAAVDVWRSIGGTWNLGATDLVRDYADDTTEVDRASVYRDLALRVDEHASGNDAELLRRLRMSTWVLGALVVEVLSLAAILLDVA